MLRRKVESVTRLSNKL